MGVVGDLLLSLAAVALVLAAPLEVAFAALAVVWLLVPPNLSVPHAPHILLVHRVVLYGFTLRLLVRRGRGEPGREAFSPTPVLGALIALVVLGFFAGVVFTPRTDSLALDIHAWFNQLDLLLLFVVALAVIRTISPWRAAAIYVSVAAVTVGIGFFEYFVHRGWSNFFYEHLPASYLAAGAGALQTRGGHVRAQGAAQFALEYGWVLVMLVPLMVVMAVRWSSQRRLWGRAAVALPLLALVATIFSNSRSATLAAVAAVILLVLMVGGNRSIIGWGVGATLVGALVAVVHPSTILAPFSLGKADPASVRLDRLPPLFALVVHHSFTGLGFGGISAYFNGLDNGYAALYATLGVLGVMAWLSVVLVALVGAGGSLRAPRGSSDRMLGVACMVGLLASLVAGAAYDIVNTAQSTWTLVMLAALGVAATEILPRPAVPVARSRARLVLPIFGALLGLGVYALAPVSSSQSMSVITISPNLLATEPAFYPQEGTVTVNTLCEWITNPDEVAPGTYVDCLQGSNVFPTDFPGLAMVTVRGTTPGAVRSEIQEAFREVHRWMIFSLSPIGSIQTGKAAWATTAPVSGGVVGLLAMLLFPAVPWTRRREESMTRASRPMPSEIALSA
jgi:hypothetical protein